MTEVLLVDNYDSFVYNIAQYLGELGADVVVERNDSSALDRYFANVDGYVISPGPGHPRDSKRSLELISQEGFGRPVLGVCLGHQAIAMASGCEIVRASRVLHGKLSTITHSEDELFEGVPSPFSATRYHSLLVSRERIPENIQILAETAEREIMSIRVRGKPIYGVQFHPESVLTSNGKRLLSNFLEMCRR